VQIGERVGLWLYGPSIAFFEKLFLVALPGGGPKGHLALPLWIPGRQLDSWTVYTLILRPFAWRFARSELAAQTVSDKLGQN